MFASTVKKLIVFSLFVAGIDSFRGLCTNENCGANSECLEVGDEAVCLCHTGFYSPSGSQRDCTDRNECTLSPCGSYSTCTNTIGSYRCVCFGGYVSDTNDGVNCRPTNPNMNCNFGHSCGINSRCARTSTVGTAHRCSCYKGYYSTNNRNCMDRDECHLIPNGGVCSAKSRCVNVIGDVRCDCEMGFQNDMTGRCVDVDECETRPCGPNAACLNTYGSYTCQCSEGYYSAGGRGRNCMVDPSGAPHLGGGGGLTDWCYSAMVAAVVAVTLLILLIICFIAFAVTKRKRSNAKGSLTQ